MLAYAWACAKHLIQIAHFILTPLHCYEASTTDISILCVRK